MGGLGRERCDHWHLEESPVGCGFGVGMRPTAQSPGGGCTIIQGALLREDGFSRDLQYPRPHPNKGSMPHNPWRIKKIILCYFPRPCLSFHQPAEAILHNPDSETNSRKQPQGSALPPSSC